jgi:hypothetical protein
MYGDVDEQMEFPSTPEEWATERWFNFSIRKNPGTPWLKRSTQRRVDNFRVVVGARWPTVQDLRLSTWGRRGLQTLSAWRYALGFYSLPYELKLMQRLVDLRKPEVESL